MLLDVAIWVISHPVQLLTVVTLLNISILCHPLQVKMKYKFFEFAQIGSTLWLTRDSKAMSIGVNDLIDTMLPPPLEDLPPWW